MVEHTLGRGGDKTNDGLANGDVGGGADMRSRPVLWCYCVLAFECEVGVQYHVHVPVVAENFRLVMNGQ